MNESDAQLRQEIELRDETIKSLRHKIADYEAYKVKTQQDLIVLVCQKKELTDNITRYESHIEDLDKALQEIMGVNKELTDQLTNRNTLIQQLEIRISEDNAKLDLLQNELNEKNGSQLSSTTLRSKDAVIKNAATLAQTQKELIEAKNKITQLSVALEETKKEAAKSYMLQTKLDNCMRELNLTRTKLDQRELELQSDKDSRKELDQRINRYREQIEELIAQGNEQYVTFCQQVEYYKKAAVEEAEEREKAIKKYEKKNEQISELKKALDKYEGGKYGLKEAAAENRALKTMLSQRQAAIADYVFQISIYERIIAALELELPESFDFNEFAKKVFDDVDDSRVEVSDATAVRIMRKAISKQQNKDASINVIMDHESTLQPPKDIITRPFNNTMSQSMKNRSQPLPPLDTGVIFPNENDKTLFSFTGKLAHDNMTLRMSSEDLLAPKRQKVHIPTVDEGVQFDGTPLRLTDNQFSEDSDAQVHQLEKEIGDLYARLDLYKNELDKARKANELLTQQNDIYKQTLNNQRYSPSSRTETSISSKNESIPVGKTETHISTTPTQQDEFDNTQVQSLPPVTLSAFDNPSDGASGAQQGIDTGTNMQSIEVSESDPAENMSREFLIPVKNQRRLQPPKQTLDTINEEDGRISLQDMRKRRISYDASMSMRVPTPPIFKIDLPREVFAVKPHKTLASEMCTFAHINDFTIEASKLSVVSSFDAETIDEIDIPIQEYLKKNGAEILIALKKDEFLIQRAQVKNHKQTLEKLQRKASTRKHKISDLNEKLKHSDGIHQNLQNTIDTLKNELATQRQEFQEKLLQMRTETDRFLELQVGEMKRAQEFDNRQEIQSEIKKSEELIEVSRLLSQLKSEKRQLENALEESRETARYMQRRNKELSDQVRQLEEQRDDMNAKTIAPPSPNTDFQKYAKKLKERLRNLEEKHKDLQKENEELKRKLSTKKDIYGFELVEQPVDDVRGSKKSLNASGEMTQSSAAALQSSQESVRVKKMQLQMEEMSMKNGELQVLLARAQENIKKLQRLLSQKEETLAQKQQQCALLKQQVLAKQKKIEDMRARTE